MNIIELLLQVLLSPPVLVPLIFPGFLTVTVVLLFIIWFERKLTAKVQLRYGPLYVFKPLGGALQMLADLLKFTFSEVIVPKDADRKTFLFSPILLFTLSLLPVVAIPMTLSSEYTISFGSLSLLIVMALLTLTPTFILLLGWSSDNKFSLIGSLREGYMMMAYEIPMFISLLAMAVLYNSLDLAEITIAQANGLWGIVLNPLASIALFWAILMTTARFPFDITEAESEIVIGPYTEYSGVLFVLCMGAPYVKLYVLSLLYAIVFLGGWNPVVWPLTAHPLLPGLMILFKGVIIMGLCVFMRSIYPRYRIDQALRLGWHKLVVLSLISVVLSLLLVGLGVI
jgi:NADH-quinone oxidoreductase subunit H